IDLSVHLPEDPCIVDVDPTRFVQILSNLLLNAAKFTNGAGSVRISAETTRATGDGGPHVSISVVDSGVGISADFLPHVFDLFAQGGPPSSQPGLGIGLALARRLVELHGGRLDGHSEGAGQGSQFVIQLPLAATQSIPATERPADDPRLERRVLVIDDNQDAANATALLIEEMGGEVKVAYAGED